LIKSSSSSSSSSDSKEDNGVEDEYEDEHETKDELNQHPACGAVAPSRGASACAARVAAKARNSYMKLQSFFFD
jgi:hypothetical protein